MTKLQTLPTEHTPEGEQTIAPGIAPITLADRLTLRAAAPMEPTRLQKPCDHGLFDEVRRNQVDLIDYLRAASSGASFSAREKE